ncbi:hypothetical protein Q7P37_009377 [Cladosporium fusiforme]
MMSTETSAATPVRVPKLAVRNKTSGTTGASHASSNNASDQMPSSHSSTRTASPQRDRGTSNASQSSRPSNMDASDRRSGSSQGKRPQSQPQQTNNKKKNGMLGFLTLKEPSTSALEQFAEQQKKAAAAKTAAAKVGGRSTAVGQPNVSTQKLPEHVPKVNSKWDGLPEDARKKLDHQRKTSQEQGSLFTISSRQTFRSSNSSSDSSTSTRRPIGSISSRPSSMGSGVRTQQKYTVIHPTAKYDTTTPISVHPDPHDEPSTSSTAIHPAMRAHASANESHNLASPTSPTTPSPLSPVHGHRAVSVRRLSGSVPAELAGRAIAELPGDGPVELPADEPPQMAGDEPAAYTTSPAGGSPLTPPANGIPEQTPRVLRPAVVLDAQGTMWYSDTDPESEASDSEAILPKPFLKRPMMEDIAESPIEYPETPEDWPLPSNALRSLAHSNSNLAIAPSADSNTPINPPERLHVPTSIFSIHAAGNNQVPRPPSLAPSVASTIDWPLPPSSRLKMAQTSVTPRKADVAPWERFDAKADVLGNSAGASGTAAATSPTSAKAGSKKRFSGILGRK